MNDGPEPLVYVGMAAVGAADIVEYPESDKIAGSFESAGGKGRKAAQAGYFEGEKDAG